MQVRVVPAKYVMKCDDDTFVRIDSVLDQVKKIRSDRSVYVGSINYFHRPLRSGKWAVTYEVNFFLCNYGSRNNVKCSDYASCICVFFCWQPNINYKFSFVYFFFLAIYDTICTTILGLLNKKFLEFIYITWQTMSRLWVMCRFVSQATDIAQAGYSCSYTVLSCHLLVVLSFNFQKWTTALLVNLSR